MKPYRYIRNETFTSPLSYNLNAYYWNLIGYWGHIAPVCVICMSKVVADKDFQTAFVGLDVVYAHTTCFEDTSGSKSGDFLARLYPFYDYLKKGKVTGIGKIEPTSGALTFTNPFLAHHLRMSFPKNACTKCGLTREEFNNGWDNYCSAGHEWSHAIKQAGTRTGRFSNTEPNLSATPSDG